MATLLLENGADINAVDELGKTPLDIASESKKGFLVVQLLIERGALRSTEESRRLRAVHPEPQSDLVKSSGSCVQ
jgi:ankyrin repeat protein